MVLLWCILSCYGKLRTEHSSFLFHEIKVHKCLQNKSFFIWAIVYCWSFWDWAFKRSSLRMKEPHYVFYQVCVSLREWHLYSVTHTMYSCFKRDIQHTVEEHKRCVRQTDRQTDLHWRSPHPQTALARNECRWPAPG